MTTDRPDPLSTDLVDLLIHHAQNGQMIDTHFTYAGALLLRAASEITKLRQSLTSPQLKSAKMTRRTTQGERIAGRYGDVLGDRYRTMLQAEIDRAIRRAKAEAFDQCVYEAAMRGLGKMQTTALRAANPYRKGAKR